MIAYENVSCGYSSKRIVKGASFFAPEGKITSVIGRNGAGKSTLLSCLNGSIRYTGTISIGGRDIKRMTKNEKAQLLSYLPQFVPSVPFTVRELTEIGRKPYAGMFSRLTQEDIKWVERAMELTDITHLSERRVDTLSGGERQRAYLSMAIAQNTDVIALDEAFSQMDASVEGKMLNVLHVLSREMGKTILLVMHSLSGCVNNTDHVAVMDEGVIRASMPSEEIRKTDIIETVFGVQKGEVLLEDGQKKTIYI